MLPIEAWLRFFNKKLSGSCLGLLKKENIFIPEIWDSRCYRMMVETSKGAILTICKIYKTLQDQLFSNISKCRTIFEISVTSVISVKDTIEFPFQNRLGMNRDFATYMRPGELTLFSQSRNFFESRHYKE